MTLVNKVKSLTARATMADKDVRSLLEKDHEEAKELLKQIMAATPGRRRMSLLKQLKTALTAHSRAEESAVYDRMLTAHSSDSRDLANEGYVEHGIVDQLLVDLANGMPSSSRWLAGAKVLKEMLEHHIDEEQTDIFAELGEHFSTGQLSAMGLAFLRTKAAILESTSNLHRPRKVARKASTRGSKRSTALEKVARAAARPRARTKKGARGRSHAQHSR